MASLTTLLRPLVLVLALVPAAGHAASIDCGKAAAAAERAICADRPLVRLDTDVNREFARLLEDFAVAAGSPRSPAVTALRDSQRNWLRQRDDCGADAACLNREYRRRLATFARRPDAVTTAADPYVGTFGDPNADPAVTVSVMRGSGDDVLAMIDVAGADAACRVVGIGRLDARRHLTITIEPAPGPDAALLVEAIPEGIVIRDSAVAWTACGQANLAGGYPRQGPGKPGPAVPDGGSRFELQTDYGPLTLVLDPASRTVSGFYPDYRGQIIGTLSADGRAIIGEWFQSQGDGPCTQANHGTMHWGKLILNYPERPQPGDAMTGLWSYCDARPTRKWNGRFDAAS